MKDEYFLVRLVKVCQNNYPSPEENFAKSDENSLFANQQQRNNASTDKWNNYENSSKKEGLFYMQKQWHLQHYDFGSKAQPGNFLSEKKLFLALAAGWDIKRLAIAGDLSKYKAINKGFWLCSGICQ